MPRSSRTTIAVPNPILDGLEHQIKNGVISYPSKNSAWVGLARYQLIVGKPHPITSEIARMHEDDQDMIDDLLFEVASHGLSLSGRFLDFLVRRAVEGEEDPAQNEVITRLLPQHILEMAKRFAAGEDVISEIKNGDGSSRQTFSGGLTAPPPPHSSLE